MFEVINGFVAFNGYTFKVDESHVGTGFQAVEDEGRKIWFKVERFGETVCCWFGDWRTGEKFHCFNNDPDNVTEVRAYKKAAKEIELERKESEVRGRLQAEELWTRWKVSPTFQSDYLERKSLGMHEPPAVAISGEADAQKILVVPMFDETGMFWNYQRIYRAGNKRFHQGGRTKGLSHTITGEGPLTYIGEGYATCLAAFKTTGSTTVCAFSCANLESVVRQVVRRVDPANVVLLVDWDGGTFQKVGHNPGAQAAQLIAGKYKVKLAFPCTSDVLTNVDFADLDQVKREERLGQVFTYADVAGEVYKLKKVNQGVSALIRQAVARLDGPLEDEPADDFDDVPLETFHVEHPEPEKTWKREAPEPAPKPSPEPEVQADFPTMADGFFFKHVNDKGAVKWVPDYDGFAYFMRAKHFLKTNDGFMYHYADRHYKSLSALELESVTKRSIRSNQAPNMITNFTRIARMDNFVHASELVEPKGLINLANGVLDVRKRELMAHGPKHFFRYKLPHEFNPKATCPTWLEFLERTLEGNMELVNVLAEIFGYTMMGGDPFLHKAFVLSGEGRNGKSAVLDVLKYLIGPTNFSSIPVENLNKPFSVVMADGKLANIIGETTSDKLNSEAFKTAVGGEQLIAAQKNMPEFAMTFTARIIMACNKLPHLGDATTGAYEKFFIIPFNRYLQESERTAGYAALNLFPEISGIINWALDGLERMRARGNRLPKIDAVAEQTVELREENDTVFAWMVEHLKYTPGTSLTHQFKDYFPHYVSWCERLRRHACSQNTFCKRIAADLKKNPHVTHSYHGRVFTVTSGVEVLVKPATGAGLQY